MPRSQVAASMFSRTYTNSPDYNAIEVGLVKVKAYLRKVKARTVDALYQALALALDTISPADALHFVQHARKVAA